MKIRITQTVTVDYEPELKNYEPSFRDYEGVIETEKDNLSLYPGSYMFNFADAKSDTTFELIES